MGWTRRHLIGILIPSNGKARRRKHERQSETESEAVQEGHVFWTLYYTTVPVFQKDMERWSELIDVKQEVKGTRELGMTRELELKNLKAAVMDFIQARKLDLDDSAMITLKESLK